MRKRRPKTVTEVERRKRVVTYVTVKRRVVTVEQPYVAFGQAVRELRGRANLTQEKLATLTNLTRTSIVNIETGRQRVLLADLWAFARGLNTTPRKLLNAIEARL